MEGSAQQRGAEPNDGRQRPIGIGMGNPGVFQGYLYPYPRKPVPLPRGMGFNEYRCGFRKNPGVCNPCAGMPPKSRLRNLATAVQVSIDTAMHIARLTIRWGVGIHPYCPPCPSFVGRSSMACWRVAFTFWTRVSVRIRVLAGHWRRCGMLMDHGCDGRTPLAWLSEHSQGGVWGKGPARCVRGLAAFCIGSLFVSCVLGSASAVFVSFAVVVVLTNQICQ